MVGKINIVVEEPAQAFDPTLEEGWEKSEVETLKDVLRESRSHVLDAGHLSPRCEYHGECRCGRDDLLQRIEAVLGE